MLKVYPRGHDKMALRGIKARQRNYEKGEVQHAQGKGASGDINPKID